MVRFRPRLIPTLAAAAATAVAAMLCVWQLGRAHEKQALADQLQSLSADPAITVSSARIAPDDIEWRRVTARGRFEPRYTVLIDNRIHHGRPGYHVIMPLAPADDGPRVLVNRGWVAANADRSKPPSIRTPSGTVEIGGMAVVPGKRFLELSDRVTEGNVWQNLTLQRYREAFPLPIQPFLIRQDSVLDDGLVREWSPPDLGVDRHYGYAFQWGALGLTVVGFWLVTQLRRKDPSPPSGGQGRPR